MCIITFVGAAGSGKTTIAKDLFVALKKKGYNTELTSEWIREDIQANGHLESIWEQYRTRMKQMEREDAVPKNIDYHISDSGTLTMFFYAALYANKTKPRERLVLSDMYKYFLDDIYLKRYDYVFFLPSCQTYEKNMNILNDGTRFQTEEEIDLLNRHMSMMFTEVHKTENVFSIDSPIDKRLNQVLEILKIK